MRVTMLNGLRDGGRSLNGQLAGFLRETLDRYMAEGPSHPMWDERFAPCQGCFGCWVEHPGVCHTRDEGNSVMADIIGSDAVFFLTQPRFGAWDPATKAGLDRSIGLLSPFFTTMQDETHHRKRYEEYPRWAVLAEAPADTPEHERRLFERIVARNVLNMQSTHPWVGWVSPDAPRHHVRSLLVEGIVAAGSPVETPFPEVQRFVDTLPREGVPRGDRPRHAVVWVGSAKPAGTSTSEGLGQALLDRLAKRGWTTEVVHAAGSVQLSRRDAPALLDAVERADLLIVASPVYVDCLPSLVLAGLARLADADLMARPVVLPMVQCGFPEVEQTELAVRVVENAVREAGWGWAGPLAVGGGGMLGGSLEKGHCTAQREGLDQAADALDAGEGVPMEATERFAMASVSPGAYRLAGQAGWLWQAFRNRALSRLGERPFKEASDFPSPW